MKVSIIVLIYNAKRYIEPLFASIFSQTYKNLDVVAVINGDSDGSKNLLQNRFQKVRIIDPKENLWFSKGNNLAIRQTDGEFVYLVNQDVVLEPDNVEKLVAVFNNSRVAAATGKVLRYDFANQRKTSVIDTTGIIMNKAGRGRDRGQNEIDQGQFDKFEIVFGVSGAVAMYRRSALESVKYGEEYFDEDFVAYWEDVDLSWRLNRAGFLCAYVPDAVSYHGRTAGGSKGGYLRLISFIKHHRSIPKAVRKLGYKNHILMYLKNSPVIHPLFLLRELIMLGYVILFETSTLCVIPELLSQIPRALKKRRG